MNAQVSLLTHPQVTDTIRAVLKTNVYPVPSTLKGMKALCGTAAQNHAIDLYRARQAPSRPVLQRIRDMERLLPPERSPRARPADARPRRRPPPLIPARASHGTWCLRLPGDDRREDALRRWMQLRPGR